MLACGAPASKHHRGSAESGDGDSRPCTVVTPMLCIATQTHRLCILPRPPQLSLDMPAAHMQQPGQSTAVMIAAAGLQEHSTRGHVTPRQCRRVQRDPAAPTYPQMSAVGGPHLQICSIHLYNEDGDSGGQVSTVRRT